MTLKLETGKRYVRASGNVTTPLQKNREGGFEEISGQNYCWDADGSCTCAVESCSASIVAEYAEPDKASSESDTTNPKDSLGLKKPPLRLVPAALHIFVAKVMGLGALKYGPYNWRTKKVRLTVYLEAAQRHILAKLDGQDVDPESGQPHEAHAAACMGIVLDAMATGNLIDDRPPAGAAERLLRELTES